MAVSGTTAFDLDFTEIAEEAWERAGREMRTGYDLRTARRSMNLMTIEWQNRGLNMWTIDEGSVPLAAGTAEYSLPADTIDVLDTFIRTGTGDAQSDRPLSRMSVSVYAGITNKTLSAAPLNVFIRRLRANPTAVLWPVPDQGTVEVPVYTLRYWRMRRVQDAGNGVETPDVSFRFYPAMCAGLAYHIATKVPELEHRIDMLKQQYDEQYNLAAGEDREKAVLRFHPRIY